MSQKWRALLNASKAARRFPLPKGRFGRAIALLAGGAALGQATALLASPVLTRIYDAEAFGVLSVYASLLAILSVVVSMRYEQAIPVATRDRGAAALFVLALCLGGSIAVAVAVFGYALVPALASRYYPSLIAFWWLLPIGMLGSAIYQTLSHWAIRQGAYRRIAQTSFGQSTVQATFQVGLGLLGAGPLGLLIGHATGQYGGTITLARAIGRTDRHILLCVGRRRLGWAARRFRRFPAYSAGASLLNMAGLQIPALFFAGHYGLQVAGLLALGQRVLALPIRLVGRSVAQAYLGEAARLHRHDPRALHSLFQTTTRQLVSLSLIPAVAIVLTAPPLFQFAFGPEWREAGVYVQVLAVSFLAQLVVSPLSQTLNVTGRQSWQLAWDAVRTGSVAVCFAFVAAVELPPRSAIAYYAGILVALYAVLYWMIDLSLRRDAR